MATKGLGNETLVTSILRSNTVLVEVGGSVRRITVENFMNAINNGDEQMLRHPAWQNHLPVLPAGRSCGSVLPVPWDKTPLTAAAAGMPVLPDP